MRPPLRAFLFATLSIAALAPLTYFGVTQSARWQAGQRRDADKELRFAAEGLGRTIGQALDTNVREITALANTVGLLGTTDRAVLQNLLRQFYTTFPAYLGVNISTPEGNPFVMHPTDRLPVFLGDRAYFQEMLRTGRTVVSGVEQGKITRTPTIHVCGPAWTQPATGSPTLVGAVVGATGLGYLQDLTTNTVETFGDLHVRVLDGRGRVILDSAPAGAPALADRSKDPMYTAVPHGQTILRDGRNEQGEGVRAALARVSTSGVDWTIAVMRPARQIEAQARHAKVSTLIAIAATLLLGLLFAYLLAYWLARPISKLANYASHVAKDNAVPLPPLGRFDIREVGELVESVFFMVSRLERQADALRDREKEQILLARVQQELQIAERLQAGILPKPLVLPGFETAARMKPAEAVGGDYYEILPTPTGFWIAAGDVSGHGLNAGLMMLMLQSALGALAIYAPGAPPADLLQAANHLLVENIRRRLGGDDHATLVLMHVDLDGHFVFAGGHEPLLLWRKRSGSCAIIDTPGPWLGILPDITTGLSEGRGQLEPGDLLVFHSDGISESGARQSRPFGLERLRASVERLGDQPVEKVCHEILREAEEWSPGMQEDDMTIVVVRRAGA
jgi:sigma-B regulation protein RsbU (phosphoserine phosphatase)